MRSVNKVILIGNVVRAPDIVQINEGTEVAKFTIAVNEYYKKNDGTEMQLTSYIDCEVWGGLVKVVKNYLSKGSRVYVEGSIRMDRWEDVDGNNKVKFKIRVNDLILLDNKSKSSVSSNNNINDSELMSNGNQEDDDLPF